MSETYIDDSRVASHLSYVAPLKETSLKTCFYNFFCICMLPPGLNVRIVCHTMWGATYIYY